jgi:Fe-S cluster biosynthesis and repair protein YggX
MSAFRCARCGAAGPRLAAPPMPGPLGSRVQEQVCGTCWQAWLQHQTALINHYGLNLRDPQARQFLTQQTEAFLFAPNPEGT